jgi:YebC/PmpR family DNA-binding regulatory protein
MQIEITMAGHSHWAGIKHQKGIADQKRGKLFSKLCTLITAAAKTEPNPDFNPRLRTAVEKARENMVPAENIARAIKRASESKESIEELVLEAYGPGGVAILIEAVTDNRNRTIPEIKHILSEHGGKWAESGSVLWAFEGSGESMKAKFPQALSPEEQEKLAGLIEAIEDHDDVQKTITSAA